MTIPTPRGITPPAPGLEREEPRFWNEEDIPSDDDRGHAAGRQERSTTREDRSSHKPERE
jgi:hypothetical protein